MKKRRTVWGSVSMLTGIVIAIIALAPRTWEARLLAVTFIGWGLWLLGRAIPLQRIWQTYRNRKQAADYNRALAETLLRHVNYRVSDCLKAAYPDARWEWTMRDPAQFVVRGGTGRIRIYGIPDYDFADVTVDQTGKLTCALVRLVPVERTEESPQLPNREEQDPRLWYNTQARETLDLLISDLESRGHRELLLKEDGSICTRSSEGGEAVKEGVLTDFPAKDCWDRLAKVLGYDGLTATVLDTGIAVTW